MKTIKDRIINQPKHNGKEDCTRCFGKGYSTELTGTSWSSDFGDDVSGMEAMLNFKPCTCVSKPSKQPMQEDAKSMGISDDLVNCECCEEENGILISADNRTINGKNIAQIYSDYLKAREACDTYYEVGRASAFQDMREALTDLWLPEVKSQDEMKKQFNNPTHD